MRLHLKLCHIQLIISALPFDEFLSCSGFYNTFAFFPEFEESEDWRKVFEDRLVLVMGVIQTPTEAILMWLPQTSTIVKVCYGVLFIITSGLLIFVG